MSESIWKQEIRFRRPRRERPVEAAVASRVEQSEQAAPARARRRLFGRHRQPMPPLPPSILRVLEENRAPRRLAQPETRAAWDVPKRGELWAPEEVSGTNAVSDTGPPEHVAPSAPSRPVSDTGLVSDTGSVRPDTQEVPGTEREPSEGKRAGLRRELHLPRPARRPRAAHPVQRVVGLRVGSSHLSAAHIRNNGSAEVVQLARMPLAPGLVVNGEVREPDALARALNAFFAANKLPRKDVRLGIASNRIGVRVLEVPAIADPKQFANALAFRAQELLPIPVADAILDQVVLDEWADDEGNAMRRVLLVFAHRELVNRFVDACRGAGVRLAGIDLDPFALLRAISAPREADTESGDAIVGVAVGHDRTIVAVSDGRICDFTRVLEWGGSSLDVAIAHALDLTPSQVEPVKRALKLDGDELPDGVSPVQLEAVKAAVRSEIAVLGRELVSSLRFYQSRPGSLSIGEVLLAGGTAQLDGLAAELQQALGARVRIADPFARVVLGKRLDVPSEPSSLAIAVGLGIET